MSQMMKMMGNMGGFGGGGGGGTVFFLLFGGAWACSMSFLKAATSSCRYSAAGGQQVSQAKTHTVMLHHSL